MKATLLVGGSGAWNLEIDRKTVAGGHVPKNAAEYEAVVLRQAQRVAASDDLDYRILHGGSTRNIEIPDDLGEALLLRRAKLKASRDEREGAKYALRKEEVALKDMLVSLGWLEWYGTYTKVANENDQQVMVSMVAMKEQPYIRYPQRFTKEEATAITRWAAAARRAGSPVKDATAITSVEWKEEALTATQAGEG